MVNGEKVKRRAVPVFYLLAFGFSWLGWVPQALHARGLFPFDNPFFSLLGGGGPTLAAVAVLLWMKEKEKIRALFADLFKLRASAGWFVFAFAFWLAVGGLALMGVALTGGTLTSSFQFAWFSLPAVFLGMLISNVWEEIGWRGFALPRLQEKYADWQIAVLMGILWYAWHLPLILNPDTPMAALPWYGQALFSISQTVIYTWLYRNTGGSLFFVSVFHAMSNTSAFVLLQFGVFVSSYGFVVGITTLFAVLILLVYGGRQFQRPIRASTAR